MIEPVMEAVSRSTSPEVERWTGFDRSRVVDAVAVEEPLEIRLAGISVAVTMRTPGDDFDLVRGFLLTEGVIRSVDDIASIAYCEDSTVPSNQNIVNVNLYDPELVRPETWTRNFYATSSCGVCGKAAMDAIWIDGPRILSSEQVSLSVLYGLEEQLRNRQAVFQSTGGLHGAAAFRLDGSLIAIREDIGRHNAVDKVAGHVLANGIDPDEGVMLLISGRASFEVMQKAFKASIPIVAAISAPSSLAVEYARSANMTLIGFLRDGRCNVYSGFERIRAPGIETVSPDEPFTLST